MDEQLEKVDPSVCPLDVKLLAPRKCILYIPQQDLGHMYILHGRPCVVASATMFEATGQTQSFHIEILKGCKVFYARQSADTLRAIYTGAVCFSQVY